MPIYDPDALGTLVANAPEAGLAPVNYGKLTVDAHVLTWNRTSDGVSTPERRDLKKGETLSKGQTLELQFSVDVQELNPNLQFEYTRTISVQKTSARQKTDWSELVEPSLIKTFGKNWPAEIAKRPYVEVEDASNILGKVSKSGKTFGVPKFLSKFPNAAACQAAREKRFGAGAAAVVAGADGGTPPDSVVVQAAMLIKGIGEDTARQMFDNMPFGPYDPEVLFGLGKAKLASGAKA